MLGTKHQCSHKENSTQNTKQVKKGEIMYIIF